MNYPPPSPTDVLFTLEIILETHGPDARAAARAMAQLVPRDVDRRGVAVRLRDALHGEIGPGPWTQQERCRLATIAWRALPQQVRWWGLRSTGRPTARTPCQLHSLVGPRD